MKFELRDRDILLPISEAKFGFRIPWFANHNANQIRLRIGLKEDLPGGAAGTVSRNTAQNRLAG